MPKAVAHVANIYEKSSCNGNSSLFTYGYDHRPFRQSCMRRQMLEEKKRIDDKECEDVYKDDEENFLSSKERRKKMRKKERGGKLCMGNVLFQH